MKQKKVRRSEEIQYKAAEIEDLIDAIRNCRDKLELLEEAFKKSQKELEVLQAREEFNP